MVGESPEEAHASQGSVPAEVGFRSVFPFGPDSPFGRLFRHLSLAAGERPEAMILFHLSFFILRFFISEVLDQ